LDLSDHINFLALDSEVGPIVISAEAKEAQLIKVLLRTPESYEIMAVPGKLRKVRICRIWKPFFFVFASFGVCR
jgi:hypothetical protein